LVGGAGYGAAGGAIWGENEGLVVGAFGTGAKAGPGVGTRIAGPGAPGTCPGKAPGGWATGEGALPAVGGATPTMVPLSLLGGPPLAPDAPGGRGTALPAVGAGAAGAGAAAC
jgi:serine/threonine-protein kinase PknG